MDKGSLRGGASASEKRELQLPPQPEALLHLAGLYRHEALVHLAGTQVAITMDAAGATDLHVSVLDSEQTLQITVCPEFVEFDKLSWGAGLCYAAEACDDYRSTPFILTAHC